MSKISGKETKPEILVRKFLFSKGFRYRKNVKSLPGKPDIVLKKYNTVIFIHGCFWHGHEVCKKAALPADNREFWEKKINSNIIRDKKAELTLTQRGWSVIVVWQCEISNAEKLHTTLGRIIKKITVQ